MGIRNYQDNRSSVEIRPDLTRNANPLYLGLNTMLRLWAPRRPGSTRVSVNAVLIWDAGFKYRLDPISDTVTQATVDLSGTVLVRGFNVCNTYEGINL